MKKLLLFIILIISEKSFADLGAGTVQAVCKVTLKSGKSIEGYIKVFQGGYIRRYKPNGFCTIQGDSIKGSEFFGLQNKFISLTTSNKVYYANCPNNNDLTYKTKYVVKKDSIKLILEKHVSDVDEYELTNFILVYPKLPLNLYLDYYDKNSERLEFYSIQTKDIESIEILEKPSQYWIKEIYLAREKLNEHMAEEYKKDQSSYTDWMEPIWFHEIFENNELRKEVEQYFKDF